ncbi:MAG: COG1361 S-layer family protein [Candidatus Aenigmarchaeota archaeon]|nr:COG1361 S-layer family protein [Candidatus Aenigmarchaeota archaeon]MCK5373215.1 COG1361 S-layer family protein [Candidatus Aenigmarchaeota archaeon]
MKMKRSGVFALAIFLIYIMSSGAYASTEASLSVSVAKYEPFPVEPGSYFDIWFKVDNVGVDTAKNATIVLEPQFPFSTDDDALTVIGILNRLDSIMVKYRVKVDVNAVEGTSKLDVKYSSDPKMSVMVSDSFGIDIRTSDADINVVSIATKPAQFLPGQKGDADIVIKNTADSTLKNIKVTMDLSSATVPFAPLGKSTTYMINNMAGGEEETATFEIIATPEAISGIYKIPLTITFSDNVGNDYTSSEIVSLIVGGTPDLLVNVEPEKLFLSGTTGDIRVNIINKGLVDVKYVTVKIENTDNFELLSNDEIYIGNIDSDDFDSASFSIHISPSFSGDLSIPMTLTYMSANNDAFEVDETLEMRVYTASEAQSLGLISKSSASTIYAAIVIVAVVYIGYRKYKKRKKD